MVRWQDSNTEGWWDAETMRRWGSGMAHTSSQVHVCRHMHRQARAQANRHEHGHRHHHRHTTTTAAATATKSVRCPTGVLDAFKEAGP